MNRFIEVYDHYLARGDERVNGWLLMNSPVGFALILLGYVVSIASIKAFMADRKPFNLKYMLFVYNFLQVWASFYIFWEILSVALQSKYSLVCEPVDYSNNPLSLRILSAMHFYFLIKIVDLLDTVLFAFRKKQNQITFLHVFHHSSMVLNGWLGVKYVGGGQTFFLCMLNSFIHVIMYTYYGLSAAGPQMQKYLWWKKYLTQVQLIQFFFVMVHSIVNVFSECSYQKGYSIAFISYGLFITALFMNFYIKSYSQSPKKQRKD